MQLAAQLQVRRLAFGEHIETVCGEARILSDSLSSQQPGNSRDCSAMPWAGKSGASSQQHRNKLRKQVAAGPPPANSSCSAKRTSEVPMAISGELFDY